MYVSGKIYTEDGRPTWWEARVMSDHLLFLSIVHNKVFFLTQRKAVLLPNTQVRPSALTTGNMDVRRKRLLKYKHC